MPMRMFSSLTSPEEVSSPSLDSASLDSVSLASLDSSPEAALLVLASLLVEEVPLSPQAAKQVTTSIRARTKAMIFLMFDSP